MERDNNVKTIGLTWHNILSILQEYLRDPLSLAEVMEQSVGTGR